MNKKFSKWIKFNGTICPVNSGDTVIVQLGDTLTLGEQKAHTLNWDKGVVTAYRVECGEITPPTSLEDLFLQIIKYDDYHEPNPFYKINLKQLDYNVLVNNNNEIMQDFIYFVYGRLGMLLNMDWDYVPYELTQIKNWLLAKEIFCNIVSAYKNQNLSLIVEVLSIPEKSILEQIKDFKEIISKDIGENNQLKLIDYINSIEEIYMEFFSYKI